LASARSESLPPILIFVFCRVDIMMSDARGEADEKRAAYSKRRCHRQGRANRRAIE
jgi:hypothetical protein